MKTSKNFNINLIIIIQLFQSRCHHYGNALIETVDRHGGNQIVEFFYPFESQKVAILIFQQGCLYIDAGIMGKKIEI